MRRAIASACCAIAWLASLPALGQPPHPSGNTEAIALAKKLGDEKSAEGLDTIIGTRNRELLESYARGYYAAARREPIALVPPAIEALIVKHFGDPEIGPLLRDLHAGIRVPYQTRELFDLHLAEWRSGKARRSTHAISQAALNTVAEGVEALMLSWLQSANPPSRDDTASIADFLARRRFQPAMPWFVSRLRAPQGQSVQTIARQLQQIDGRAAQEPLLAFVAESTRDGVASTDAEAVLSLLVSRPTPDEVPTYSQLRRALPATLTPKQARSVLQAVRVRKEVEGAAEAVLWLRDETLSLMALEVLLELDAPEGWKLGREEVTRLGREGTLPAPRVAFATARLDEKIADPGKHRAEQRAMAQSRAFQDRRDAIVPGWNHLQALRASQPGEFVAQGKRWLAQLEALLAEYPDLPQAKVGLAGDIANHYVQLAHAARFRLKQPRQAIELFDASERLVPGLGALWAADTFQFDLKDHGAALARFRVIRSRLEEAQSSPQGSNDYSLEWPLRWLAHQVAFLETGKRFSGKLERDEIEEAKALLLFGSVGAVDEGLELPREGTSKDASVAKLAALPPSSHALLRASVLLLSLGGDRMLEEFARHDPAGYASASLLAVASRGEMFAVAHAPAERFFRERRITLAPALDLRMDSPEKTWDLLRDALRSDRLEVALQCMTPALRRKFRPLFTQMGAAKRRELADSFSPLVGLNRKTDAARATVAIRGAASGISFQNQGGTWVIVQM